LEQIGCEIAPLGDWDEAAKEEFKPEEVEHMAAMEHHRYVIERSDAPPAESAARYAAEFADLDDDAKEKNRNAVRAIPKVLASVGLQFVRISPASESARLLAPPPGTSR
jgi:hypothetical protein